MTLVKLNNRFDSQVNRYNSFDSLFDSFSNSQPSVNIIETDEAFVIELAVPGYAKKDISIGLENNVLTVSHEHLEDQKQDLPAAGNGHRPGKGPRRRIPQRRFLQTLGQ